MYKCNPPPQELSYSSLTVVMAEQLERWDRVMIEGELDEQFFNIYLRSTLSVSTSIYIHEHTGIYCSCTLNLYLD